MANNERGQTLTSYQNHYNAKLNKCFYLQQVQYYPKNKNDSSSEERLLYDINENREYGMFRVMANYGRLFDRAAPTDCYVLDKRCSSDREWETLIKPYMEE